MLQQLAMKYGKHPACLGWGLLNEPVSPSPGTAPGVLCVFERETSAQVKVIPKA